jgi:hypothetical protein
MSLDNASFQFKEKPSGTALAEIAALEQEGYFIHREWANGVELRKPSMIGAFGMSVRCLLVLLMPVVFLPFFGRSILSVILGYKLRVFVTRDAPEPRLFLC